MKNWTLMCCVAFLSGCATIHDEFRSFLDTCPPQNRYGVLSLPKTADGSSNYLYGWGASCFNDLEKTKIYAVENCQQRTQKACIPVKVYDRKTNEVQDLESRNMAEVKQARNQAYLDALRNQCDAFGYQRGTQAHSDCMMKLNQQTIQLLQQQQALKQQKDISDDQKLFQSLQMLQQSGKMLSPQPSNNLNCQSIKNGNVVNTNCW